MTSFNRVLWVPALAFALSVGCGDDSNGGGGSGGTADPCPAVCDNEVECNDTPRGACTAVCAAALAVADASSPACSDAVNAVLSCAGVLSCTEYQAWQNEEPPDSFPCRAETETCNSECDNLCDEEFDF